MAALGWGRGPSLVINVIISILMFSLTQQALAAPVLDHSTTEIEPYHGEVNGCYYNFQHYEEGDRILTNEPCLNCTCHNRMLMCYLRVCPFTKAIGQDCKIEKRPDQCCPVITCPEVPVQLLTSTTTQSPSTEVGHIDNYGCSINNLFYSDGARVPSDPKKPCELCYCIRNKTTCIMQECTLKVEGCKPVYQPGVCCPVRYDCDREETELLETTVHPTTGLLLTTTLSPGASTDCKYQDNTYFDGESIHTENPCEHCYCMRGEIVCAVQECGKPMEKTGTNCISIPKEGQCCPEYECDNTTYVTTLPPSDEITTVGGEKNVVENEILEEKVPLLQTTLDDEVQENPQERPINHINKADDSQIPLTSDLPETDFEIDHKVDQTDLEKDHKVDQMDLEKDHKVNQTDLEKDHKIDQTDLEKDHKVDQADLEKDHKIDQADLEKDHTIDQADLEKDHKIDQIEIEKDNKVDQTAAPPLDESQTHIPEDWSHKITTENQKEITVDESLNKIEDYQKDVTTEGHELPTVIHSEHTDERKTDMKVDNLITDIPNVSPTEKTIDSTTNERDSIGESEIQPELQKTDTESTNFISTSEETIPHDKKVEITTLLPQISEEETELPKSDTEPLEVIKDKLKPSTPEMLPSYTEMPQKESSTEIEDYVKGTSHEHFTTEANLIKEKISTSLFDHDYVTNIPPTNEIHTTEIDKQEIFETGSKLAPGQQSIETDEGKLYTSELPTHTEKEGLSTSKPITLPDQISPQEISTIKTNAEKEVTSYPEMVTTINLENDIENEQVLTATDKTGETIDKHEDVSTNVPLTENIEDILQETAKPIKEVSLDVTTEYSQNKEELSPAIVRVEGDEVLISTSERIDEFTTQKQERVPETTDNPTEEKIIELETTAKIPEEIQKAEVEFPLKSEEQAQEQERVTDSQEEKVTEIYNIISPTTQKDSTSDTTLKKEEPEVKPNVQYETPVPLAGDNQEITTELHELAKLPESQTEKSIETSDNTSKEKTTAPVEITEEPQKALDDDISSPSKNEIAPEPALPELTTEYTLQEHETDIIQEHVKEKTQEPEISHETTEHSYEKHEPEVLNEYGKTQEPEISQETTEHLYEKHEPEIPEVHETTLEPEISQETTEHSYEKHEPEVPKEHEKTQEPDISQETTEHLYEKHEPEVPEVPEVHETTQEPEISQEITEHSYEKHEPEVPKEHEKTQEPEISQETTEHLYEKHEPEVPEVHETTQEPEISQEITEHSYEKHEPEVPKEHEKTQEPEISQETTEHLYEKHEQEVPQEHEKTQQPEISQETTEHLYEKHEPEVTQEYEKTDKTEISQETTEHSYEKHEPQIIQKHEKTDEPELVSVTTERIDEEVSIIRKEEKDKTQESDLDQVTTEHIEEKDHDELPQTPIEYVPGKQEVDISQEYDTDKTQELELPEVTTEHKYKDSSIDTVRQDEKAESPEKKTTDKPEIYKPETWITTTEQPEIIHETTTMNTKIQKDKEKLDEGIIKPVEIEKDIIQINEEFKPTEISVNKQTTLKVVTEESENVDQDINKTTVKVSPDLPHSEVYASTESIPEIGPQLIPGEGDCLVEKITYLNNTNVPSINPCQLSCKCISSIVQCVMIECTPPPPEMIRCTPVFHDSDACCPTYNCEGEESDVPKSDSQMKETDEKIPNTPPKTPESLATISMESVETSSQHAEKTTEKASSSYIPPKESTRFEATISSKSTEEIPLSTPSYISVQSSNENIANDFDKELTSRGPVLENKVSNSETSTVFYEERTETIPKLSSVGITLEDDNQQKILNKPEEPAVPAVPATESEVDLEEKLATTTFSIFRASEEDKFTTAEKEITTEYYSPEHKYSPQIPEDESTTSSVSQKTTTLVAEVVKDKSEEEKGSPSHETVTPFVDTKVSTAEFDHDISSTKQSDENEIETNKYPNDKHKPEEPEQSISETTTSFPKNDDKEFSSITTKKPESLIENSTEEKLSTEEAAELTTEHAINKESNEIDKETTGTLQDTEKRIPEDQATYKPIEVGINEIIPEQPISSYKPVTDSSLETENEYEITSQQLDSISPTEKEQSPEFNEILNEVSKLPEESNFVQEHSTIPSNEIEKNAQTTKVTKLPNELHKIPTNESNEIADISDFPKEVYTTVPIVDSTILKQEPDTLNEADEEKKYTTFGVSAVTEAINLDDSSAPGKGENLPQKPQTDISTEVLDTLREQHKDTTITLKEQEKETSDKTEQIEIEAVSTEFVVYQDSITTKPDYKEEEKETTSKEEIEEAYTSRVVTEELPSSSSETHTASPEEFYEHSTKLFTDDNILQEILTSTTKRAEELTTRKSEEDMIPEKQKHDDTHDTVLDNEKDKEKTNIVPEIEKTSVPPVIIEEGSLTTEREQPRETVSIIPEDEKRIDDEFDSKEPGRISTSKPTELYEETTEGRKSGETATPVSEIEKPFKPTIASLENEISSSITSSGAEIYKTEKTTSLISEDGQLNPDLVSVNELIPGSEQYELTEVTTDLHPEIVTPEVHLVSEQEKPEVTTSLPPEKDIPGDKKPIKVESEILENEKSELTTASLSVEGQKSTAFPPINEITTFSAVSESEKSSISTEKAIETTSIKLPESHQKNKTGLVTEILEEITTSSDNLVKTTLHSDISTSEAITKVPEPQNISTSVQEEKQNTSTITPISPQEPDYVQVPIIQEQSTEHIPVSNELYTSSPALGSSTESIHDNLSTQNSLHITASVPEQSIGTQKPEDVNLQHVTKEPYKPSYPDNLGQIPQHVPEEEIEHHKPSKPDYQHPNADDFGQIPPYPEVDDYEEEDNTPFGPGTCRYGGKVYVSAQQIPRDDPCDFCFCFRSDIICLQQSCPPPIPGCHEEPIQGFCCPRYECPVSMATVLNLTTTTTTTTTTLPPHFLHHAYRGSATRTGCQIQGKAYRVGEIIKSKSGPCLHCTCGGDGQMKCDPKVCSPQPMIQQMIAAATASRRR